MIDVECKRCGRSFPALRKSASYCSGSCRELSRRARNVDAKGTRVIHATPANRHAFPQFSSMAVDANLQVSQELTSRVASLPDGMDQITRERWIAVLSAPGSAGFPGPCKAAKCDQAIAAIDTGLCMRHDIEGPRRRVVRL